MSRSSKATTHKSKRNNGKRGALGAKHVPLAMLAGASARAADVLHDEQETKPVARRAASGSTAATGRASAVPGGRISRVPGGRVSKVPGERVSAVPSAPIEVLLHDARELLSVARRAGRKLVKAGLDERMLKELPTRIALVADAQKALEKQRAMGTTSAMRKTHDEAIQLKTDLLAAGRYVLRHDADAQRQLDRIAEGDGSMTDLIGDLRALAKCWQPRASRLAEGDVASDAPTRARELADELAATTPREAAHGTDHHEHRNRAVAMLDEAVTEVRAAGRYVFRRVPAQLALFRHEFKRAHDARVTAKAATKKAR